VSTGKSLRLKRLIDPHGVALICALDHGMTSPRFLDPLADIAARAREAIAGGSNAIMISKGMLRIAAEAFEPDTAVCVMLSASSRPQRDRPDIVAIAKVEEALRLGADAVVLYVSLEGDDEPHMLATLAEAGRECERLGVPLIAEAEFPTTYASVDGLASEYGLEYLERNVRLCAELGADLIKTNWPGAEQGFARLVRAANGLPVVHAGGSRISDAELLQRQEAAMRAGAIGCSVGRNIFMHPHPEAMARALAAVIRERVSAGEAAAALERELEGRQATETAV
jgi:fructose-bisphosphate aldolase / 2-amino-3,7-dideoxy-D-threo-hept-6-ulosonate synthase